MDEDMTQSQQDSVELESLMYDLVIAGLPNDCAMIGGKIIAPARALQFTENRNKQIDEAMHALSAKLQQLLVEAKETAVEEWCASLFRDDPAIETKIREAMATQLPAKEQS